MIQSPSGPSATQTFSVKFAEPFKGDEAVNDK